MSKISISCSKCDQSYAVARESIGKTAKCKKCGESFTITEPPEDLLGDSDGGLRVQPVEQQQPAPSHLDDYLEIARGDGVEVRPGAEGEKAETVAVRFAAILLFPPVAVVAVGLMGYVIGRTFNATGPGAVGADRFFAFLVAIFSALFCLLSFLAVLVTLVWGALKAFAEDVIQGLLYVFVPYYALYYQASRWYAMERVYYCTVGSMAAFAFFLAIMLGLG